MITDPIGDMVARIKNAYLAKHKTVKVPFSKIKQSIANILIEEKYLVASEVIGEKNPATKMLNITLRYERKDSAIKDIKRNSSPGRRIYLQAKELKSPLSGLGTGVVSTSHGLMTIKSARKKKLGGELLLEIW